MNQFQMNQFQQLTERNKMTKEEVLALNSESVKPKNAELLASFTDNIDCVDCEECFCCQECYDCFYCFNCFDCYNCYGIDGGKCEEYVVYGVQLTEEEYEAFLKNITSTS